MNECGEKGPKRSRRVQAIFNRYRTYTNEKGLDFLAGYTGRHISYFNPLNEESEIDKEKLSKLIGMAAKYLTVMQESRGEMEKILSDHNRFNRKERQSLIRFLIKGERENYEKISRYLLKLARRKDFAKIYDKFINQKKEN